MLENESNNNCDVSDTDDSSIYSDMLSEIGDEAFTCESYTNFLGSDKLQDELLLEQEEERARKEAIDNDNNNAAAAKSDKSSDKKDKPRDKSKDKSSSSDKSKDKSSDKDKKKHDIIPFSQFDRSKQYRRPRHRDHPYRRDEGRLLPHSDHHRQRDYDCYRYVTKHTRDYTRGMTEKDVQSVHMMCFAYLDCKRMIEESPHRDLIGAIFHCVNVFDYHTNNKR